MSEAYFGVTNPAPLYNVIENLYHTIYENHLL